MQSPVEEIKARLDIVDVIGTYVQLKRAGANFSARCPFHTEKTPSFMVSRAKQLWYCFGACSEGGDMFKFLMKIDGIDFPEALKILADKAGVELPRYDARAQSKMNTLLEIMKAAAEFYISELAGPRGGTARQYLARRGLSDKVIAQFGLGYAPDSWDALTLAFRDRFKADDVFAAGLTIKSERNQNFYDRFRHRVMFPIRDIHGNPVGFTSRILDEKRVEGKYVNTPETLIYNKSRVLYGLDMAREAIRRADYAILTEGNMDVIACHQFGMINVVAASGTALTLEQVRLLKRYTGNIMICFDADRAGEKAAMRGIDIALSECMQVKVITIPAECGKDPDECVRKDVRAWEEAVRGAREIMEYYIEKACAQYDLGSAHGRSQFVGVLLAEIAKLPDLVEQDFWVKKVGEMVRVDEKLLREQMRRMKPEIFGGPASGHPEAGPPPIATRPRVELLSERLLALFMTAPEHAEEIIGTVLPEMLAPKEMQDLYAKFVSCYTAYTSHEGVRPPGWAADFRAFWRTWASNEVPEHISTADLLELRADKEFGDWDVAQLQREAQFLISQLRREHFKARRLELAEAMRQAEYAGDRARVASLAREFEALTAKQ